MSEFRNLGQLPNVAWLSIVSEAVRIRILQSCVLREAERGKVLYRFGDAPGGLYGLISGCIRMDTVQSSHGPTMLSLFHSGSWLGEVELFSRMGRLTTLTALRPTRYAFLSNAAIDAIAREAPELWKALGNLAAEHVSLAVAAMDDLAIRSSRIRVMAILLRLCGARIENGSGGIARELDVTQSELAKLANLSRSVLSDLLNEMEIEGLLSREYGKLTILDIKRLKLEL